MNTRRGDRWCLVLLSVLMIATTLASIRYGAMDFSAHDMATAAWGKLSGSADLTLDQRIFMELRLPRAILCLLVGACLGVGGTLMQALFRNPIVEPGLVGTSSGAAFGAALFYVFGALLKINLGGWTLPVAACAGGVISTYTGLRARAHQERRQEFHSAPLAHRVGHQCALYERHRISVVRGARSGRPLHHLLESRHSLGRRLESVLVVGAAAVVGLVPSVILAKPLNALMIGRRGGDGAGGQRPPAEMDGTHDQRPDGGGGDRFHRCDQLRRADRAAYFADRARSRQSIPDPRRAPCWAASC